MLEKSNLRFSYEQKNRCLMHQNDHSAGRGLPEELEVRDEDGNILDDQQEEYLMKKSTVFPGDSAKNSQVFSDMYLQRVDKIKSKKENNLSKYTFDQDSVGSIHKNGSDFGGMKTALHAPRNLPQVRKSRDMNYSEAEKWNPNVSFNDISVQEKNMPKPRVFSINHYDIYKPGFLVNRQELKAERRKEQQQRQYEQDRLEQKQQSLARSQYHQQLHEEKPHEPLKIQFQNSTDRDLLQLNPNQSQVSENISRYFRKGQEFHQEQQPKSKEQPNMRKFIENREQKQKEVQKNEKAEQFMLPPRPNRQRPEMRNRHQRVVSQFRKRQDRESEKMNMTKDILKREEKPSSKQTSRSSKKSESSQKVKAKINDRQLLEQIQLEQKQEKIKGDELQIKTEVVKDPKEKKHATIEDNFMKTNDPEISIIKKQETIRDEIEKREVPSKNDSHFEHQFARSPRSALKQVEDRQESHRPFEFNKFNCEDYSQIYEILKGIQIALKQPVVDSLSLLREIKKYLQIVARGRLDHIEGYDMPLHRLKILKNALLYERIAVVIVSFAFAIGKIKESLKYLINLVTYATNNNLLILKILETSQVKQAKNPVIAKSDRLIQKRNYDSVRNGNDIILDCIFKIAKLEEAFFESFRDIVKTVGKSSLEQTFYNVLEYFAFFLCVSNLHTVIPFLSVAPNPYLRETVDRRPTLVVDVVQVFCHGTRKSKSHIFRPHTEYFLGEMAQYYELISFTCGYPNQIDRVIDILDHKKHIKHRLYRHHALTKHNTLFKDLQRIGRDMHKLVLLDSQANAAQAQGNVIGIPPWKGNKHDTTLAELCPILATIAVKGIDCRQATRKINEQQSKNESAGIKYLNFGINLE